MTLYQNRFNRLHSDAVASVDAAAPAIWNCDRPRALRMLRTLAEDLAGTYGVPVPAVEYGDRELYRPATETMEVPKPSLVSFLHEFRHHMQKHGMQANPDEEEDARGWSISMFAEAEPEYFDSAWRDGRIWFMPEHPGVTR